MIIKISKNYCSIEFEFDGEYPDAEYLQKLYDLLPGGQSAADNNSVRQQVPPPEPGKNGLRPAGRDYQTDAQKKKANAPRPATPRQKALLEKSGYYYPGMTFEEATNTLSELGY